VSISAKTVKTQLMALKPMFATRTLKASRKAQHRIGELMESRFKNQVFQKERLFDNFDSVWLLPKDERRGGVILYLHGGGYAFGDLEYAKGFGSLLAVQTGTRVFCPAYRLAPENPFPAALDDAVSAYKYLISKGYSAKKITLCGESAGGGLCFALCLRLKSEGLPLPSGIIAISPWTDMTASGVSYEENKDSDPTMTKEMLGFYADCYTNDRKNPLVSPLFGDLSDMPPSIIFAAENEIMRSDSESIHNALIKAGAKSKLFLKPERWHAYLLYGLKEDQKDFEAVNKFLNAVLEQENRLRWLKLDNAAKMYPATRNDQWSNLFRVSATLTEEIDKTVMQSALDVTARRFPSIAVRLRKGLFWYYLQQLSESPKILDEKSYPLTRMSKRETRKCAFRVIVYKKRVAIEVFHSITDGNGALTFLKSLIAEYLWQKHPVKVPAENGVLSRLDYPKESELEDSFQKYAGSITAKRKERPAWRISGTPETAGFLNLTCFELPLKDALDKAHEYNVSLTEFLCAVIMSALQNLQKEKYPRTQKRKPIKIRVPANLRRIFPSTTLRNFVMFTIPEILPELGVYDFEEICKAVHHKMGMDITPKQMSMKIAANIKSERLMAARIMPLFVKNFIIKTTFNSVGERQACFTVSNLGAIAVPDQMKDYIERFDFILGAQLKAPHNCGILSFGDTLYINFIRDICESDLEMHIYRVLRELGLSVKVQSNQG